MTLPKKLLPKVPKVNLRYLHLGAVDRLLKEFPRHSQLLGKKVLFELPQGYDGYNPTIPFKTKFNGRILECVGLRVDKREETLGSKVMFFEKTDDRWKIVRGAPVLLMEDPFVSFIDGHVILGGVEIVTKSPLHLKTVFYQADDLKKITEIGRGPTNMKDIRLVQLPNGLIVVYTRPQGRVGGKGTIGFIVIKSLEELNPETINKAKLLKRQFARGEWGGVNFAEIGQSGIVKLYGHVANERRDKQGNLLQRNYYAMAFLHDPLKNRRSRMRIIATRSNFPDGPAKAPDLSNVLFPSGQNGHLWMGLNDAEVGVVDLPKDSFDKLKLRRFALWG